MIESITLTNFQRHRKRTIKFDPRVTTLVGPTGSGKSSIIRALKWLCLNQFDGPANSFIQWGRSFAKVSINLDGRKIVRAKGQHNRYTLDDKRFEAFASRPPEEIETLLKTGATNFQNQLDAHFWFSESAGAVVRALNKIVNLDQIDAALSSIAATIRKARLTVEVSEERLADARKARQGLAFVPEINRSLRLLERQEQEIAARATETAKLEALTAQTSKYAGLLEAASKSHARGSQAIRSGAAVETLSSKAERLSRLLERLEWAEAIRKIAPPDHLCELLKREERLSLLIHSLEEARNLKWQNEQASSEARAAMESKSKGRCPLCGQPLKS
jgi:DNA repair exonuclease SbcCD ATPase subunit